MNDIRETGNIIVTLLDDRESQNGEIHSNDAATDGFALALSGTAGTITGMTIGKEKADTSRVHDSLLHRETLLVVAAGDSKDVALEFITNAVARNLRTHSVCPLESISKSRSHSNVPIVPLLQEYTQFLLILNLNQLLAAIGRLLWSVKIFDRDGKDIPHEGDVLQRRNR